MKKFVVAFVVVAIFVGVVVGVEAAPKGKWRLLGKRTVTDRVDHDVISVTGRRGQWRAVKIVVSKHAVQFHDVKIVFANGRVQDISLKSVIPAGGSSRVIDLVGDHRVIRRVEFRYDAQSLGSKALVKVFGKR